VSKEASKEASKDVSKEASKEERTWIALGRSKP